VLPEHAQNQRVDIARGFGTRAVRVKPARSDAANEILAENGTGRIAGAKEEDFKGFC